MENELVSRLQEAANNLLDAYSFYLPEGNPWADELRAAIAALQSAPAAQGAEALFSLREWICSETEKLPEGAAALPVFDHVLNEIDRRRSTLAALPVPASGWRDMASAPKDGSSVLGAHEHAALVVYWQEDHTVDGAPGWASGETDLDGYFYTYPVTHWRPLPPLPTTPADKSEGGEDGE